jgi:phytol kinase
MIIITSYINLFIVLSLFVFIFSISELLYKTGVPVYITRKFVHIFSGVIASLLPIFLNLETTIIIGCVFSLIMLWSKYKNFFDSIHKLDEETVGALLYAPSLTLVAIIFWPINALIFQSAALILGLSDGMAGLIGEMYGKRKYSIFGNNIKTIEGSFSFFLVTFLILLFILIFHNNLFFSNKIILIFISSLILTMSEALFGKGWDNLFVPLIAGIIISFLL